MLELLNISKFYGNDHTRRDVLKDISLTIERSDTIAIIGPSGSGKSTLLNIMGTLDTPDSGIVKFNGLEIHSLGEPALADIRNRHIGFMFQLHHLLPQLNLIENVLLPVLPQKDKALYKKALARAMDLLQIVGLSDKINQFPGQMSVGECQRTAIVRALINEPELILADEPTGSLDQESAEQLGDLLLDIKKKLAVAIIVVTHSSSLAKRMSSIYKLSDGKLLPFTEQDKF
jgi:ABC-type lipoprotein export system ATPase subunit